VTLVKLSVGLLLWRRGRGDLFLQAHAPKGRAVLGLPQAHNVLDLVGQVLPFTLHHGLHQPGHRPTTHRTLPPAPRPQEQHLQHQGPQIVPGGETQRETHTERARKTETETETQTQTQTQRERERQRERDTERETQRKRDTEKERHRERQKWGEKKETLMRQDL
jgi:hypothetical protein